MNIHHIGYLVKNIDQAEQSFSKLGYETAQRCVYDEIRKINILFMKKDGYVIELVSPVNEESPVFSLIKRYGNSPYHICYQSGSFDEEIAGLAAFGWMRLGAADPAPAINNQRVQFMMNSNIGLIEILESEKK